MIKFEYVFAFALIFSIFPFKDIISVRWILKGDNNDIARMFLLNFVFVILELLFATVYAYLMTIEGYI